MRRYVRVHPELDTQHLQLVHLGSTFSLHLQSLSDVPQVRSNVFDVVPDKSKQIAESHGEDNIVEKYLFFSCAPRPDCEVEGQGLEETLRAFLILSAAFVSASAPTSPVTGMQTPPVFPAFFFRSIPNYLLCSRDVAGFPFLRCDSGGNWTRSSTSIASPETRF